jgi:thiamine-phosphate pyrophosphorylase
MLPRFVLIADAFTRPEMEEKAAAAVGAGVRWVHLRDHDATPSVFARRAREVSTALREAVRRPETREGGSTEGGGEGKGPREEERGYVRHAAVPERRCIISVNAHLDVAADLADDLASDGPVGYHAGWRGADVHEARDRLGPDAPVGYSAHERVEAESRLAQSADYFFFSPVFPTSSKPDQPGVGLAALADFCRASPIPVYALGGIIPDRVAECRDAGAYGVAVLSGVMHTPTPAAAARAYLRELR